MSAEAPKKSIFWKLWDFPWLPLLATSIALIDCYVPGHDWCCNLAPLVWLCVLFWWVAVVPTHKGKAGFTGRAVWPTLLLFCISLIANTSFPVHIMFRIFQPEFQRFVQTAPRPFKERGNIDSPILKIGPFPVYYWEMDDHEGVYIVTTLGTFESRPALFGFVYKPVENSKLPADVTNTGHIVDNWYTFTKIPKFSSQY